MAAGCGTPTATATWMRWANSPPASSPFEPAIRAAITEAPGRGLSLVVNNAREGAWCSNRSGAFRRWSCCASPIPGHRGQPDGAGHRHRPHRAAQGAGVQAAATTAACWPWRGGLPVNVPADWIAWPATTTWTTCRRRGPAPRRTGRHSGRALARLGRLHSAIRPFCWVMRWPTKPRAADPGRGDDIPPVLRRPAGTLGLGSGRPPRWASTSAAGCPLRRLRRPRRSAAALRPPCQRCPAARGHLQQQRAHHGRRHGRADAGADGRGACRR